MGKIYNSVMELVGNTPIIELKNIEKKYNLKSRIFAKVEFFNPTGSSKDRIALNMIEDYEKKGILSPGGTIIEPTSGNTGIGLAAFGKLKGYKVIIILPNTMSVERIKMIKAYGAEVILTDGKLGMKGSCDLAEKLHKETPNSVIAGQFENPANPESHYKTTGPEILRDMDGKVDFFVASIGTGGTFSGTSKFLKENISGIKAIGVEPHSSPLLTKGFSGSHKIQGIGANFIPATLNRNIIDGVIDVTDDDAMKYGRELITEEGIFSGISSGAALCGAIEVAQKFEGKNVVVLLPDSGNRYLSTDLFN